MLCGLPWFKVTALNSQDRRGGGRLCVKSLSLSAIFGSGSIWVQIKHSTLAAHSCGAVAAVGQPYRNQQRALEGVTNG